MHPAPSIGAFVTAAFLLQTTGAFADPPADAPASEPLDPILSPDYLRTPTGPTDPPHAAEPAPIRRAVPVEASATTRPTALVHITPEGFDLEARSDAWFRICSAPCDKSLPLDLDYRVIADGFGSSPFDIEASAGQRVQISVRKRSPEGVVAGYVLVGLGAVAILGSGALLLVASHLSFEDGSSGGTVALVVTGGVLGLAAMAGGIALVVVYNDPRTTQTVSALSPPRPSLRPETAWLRAPMWRDSVREGTPAVPKLGVPVLAGEF